MSVLFLTGAGISANAGIPTYRDNGASWRDPDLEKKSHSTRYGNHLDELWDKHWGPVSLAMAIAEPTYTHKAIAKFQEQQDAIIATQNIETLHERAGSDNVAHVHGDMSMICMKCKNADEGFSYGPGQGAPVHIKCGKKKVRPNVVLFGEQLNKKMMNGLAQFAGDYKTTHIISVGTSLNVWPAAALAMDNIAKVIIINKDKTPFDKWAKAVYNDDCDTVIDNVLSEVLAELDKPSQG